VADSSALVEGVGIERCVEPGNAGPGQDRKRLSNPRLIGCSGTSSNRPFVPADANHLVLRA